MAGKRRTSSKGDLWQRAQLLATAARLLIELFRWLHDDGPGPRS
jgi:hypothetical protein